MLRFLLEFTISNVIFALWYVPLDIFLLDDIVKKPVLHYYLHTITAVWLLSALCLSSFFHCLFLLIVVLAVRQCGTLALGG